MFVQSAESRICIMSEKGILKNFFQHYLPYIFLLLFFKSQLNEDLLQLFITIINNELLKAVVLYGEKWRQPYKASHRRSHDNATLTSHSTRNTTHGLADLTAAQHTAPRQRLAHCRHPRNDSWVKWMNEGYTSYTLFGEWRILVDK